MSAVAFADLREFCARLEALGELKRVSEPVDTHLELTALAERILRRQGPALLVERPHTQGRTHSIPSRERSGTAVVSDPRRIPPERSSSRSRPLRSPAPSRKASAVTEGRPPGPSPASRPPFHATRPVEAPST